MKYLKLSIILLLVYTMIIGCDRDTIPIPDELIEFKHQSASVNDVYLIRVHLPASYENEDRDFPVLYQLDGSTTTGSVIADYKHLVKQQLIRECIIVSIDYSNHNNRERDFTPTAHKEYKKSGGAQNFLNYLRDELVPKINTDYRTDLAFGNTIRGHSLGGLFTTFAMLQQVDGEALFKNYITESPSWWWDDNYVITQEDQFAESGADLPYRAYFSVGELEHVIMKGGFEVMRDRMLSRDYPGLQSFFEMLPNQTHLDVRENENGLIHIFGL